MRHSAISSDQFRRRLLSGAAAVAVGLPGLIATPALAQGQDPALEEIVVTGSRIARQDYVSNSPITTITGDQIVGNSDITLETYLNNLPQVNPAGTTTSNNPANNGQSNIDLRGFGANRNLVLVDGRRAMISANTLTVDLNTIPAALIERIEVITGGAGAAYGADAVSGAVNILLKSNFEGADVRLSYSNATEEWDSEEKQASAVVGGNFNDDKGNSVFAFDYSKREQLIKSQRDFAKFATSTTSFFPEGALFWGSNAIPLTALQQVFATYGVAADRISANSGRYGFNTDGTLFYAGIFNSPFDVQNFRGPVDDSVNQAIFPDSYSYNFDAVNILVLPLERYSFMNKSNYEFDNGIEVFTQASWTEYNSVTALAPTPIPTVVGAAPGQNTSSQFSSALIASGRTVANQLVIPVTNPFIPTDLRTLLNARTGDDVRLVGSGATEPFTMRQRTLDLGLRANNFENTVVQFLGGLRGPIADTGWNFEASASEGRTEIDQRQDGNVDTQKLQTLLEAADGGASICAGGFNPFGRQPISEACQDYLRAPTAQATTLKQQIVQGYVTGDLFEVPSGSVSAVLGGEYRDYNYEFDPGAGAGPISGFTLATRDKGTSTFKDIFAELLVPLAKGTEFAQGVDLNLGWRYSDAEFADEINDLDGGGSDHAYKAELNWTVSDPLRLRASYQRSVRAPNFGELFAGGNTAPQYFDPCSVTSTFRQTTGAAGTNLCVATGVTAGGVGTFVQNPGGQLTQDFRGNRDLQSEQADTITLGAVVSATSNSPWLSNLRGTLDYWNINISDPILFQNPNLFVADCYNYYGNNPNLSVNQASCQTIVRGGGDILFLNNNDDDDGLFSLVNAGKQKASGIDLQIDYSVDLEEVSGTSGLGTLQANVLISYLIEWKQDEGAHAPLIDYAGTVAYFGAGLGQSFPEWKATINLGWSIDDFLFNTRIRYIGAMDNRASREFVGEPEFGDVPALAYADVSATWNITEWMQLTAGLNNAFDKRPPTYAFNVQSGTDPSTYDVIGRRFFAQMRARF